MNVANLPDWPARLSEDLAAQYLSISPSTFRERVKSRAYPQPVYDGGRKFFSRRQLDSFVDAQFGLGAADNDQEGAGWVK